MTNRAPRTPPAPGKHGAPGASARSLKARAIQWLAQREHSRTELRRKLLPYALAEADGSPASVDGVEADPRHRRNPRHPLAPPGPPGLPEDGSAQSIHAKLDALLDWLEGNRYLSSQRFVESRVHARAARFGNLRIRQELAQHQLSVPVELESALRDTELDRARTVWAARYGDRPGGLAERGRQARFLAGRGFSGDVIHRVLREADAAPASAAMSELDAD